MNPLTHRTTGRNLALRWGVVAAIVVFAAAVAVVHAATVTVDDFSYDQASLQADRTNTEVGSVAPPTGTPESSIIGGQRDIWVEYVGGGGNVTVLVDNGQYNHSQDTTTLGRSFITYDGDDNNADPVSGGSGGVNLGGTPYDLRGGGSQNAFHFDLDFCDNATDVTVRVWTSTTACTEATFSDLFPDIGDVDTSVDLEYQRILDEGALGDWGGTSCTSSADFSSVKALQFEIDGSTTQALDLTIESIYTEQLDWGDLPDSGAGTGVDNYQTYQLDKGPRHVVPVSGSIYLGDEVDPDNDTVGEIDGQPNTNADRDDTTDNDDEDGVVRTAGWFWTQANGGRLDVTVAGSGCLSGWIDWNQDGDFGVTDGSYPLNFLPDAGEEVISNVAVTSGTATYTFAIPVDPTDDSFYARFRLFPREADTTCSRKYLGVFNVDKFPYAEPAPVWRVERNGEVEDYVWDFGPNAVAFRRLEARSETPVRLPALAVLLALAAAGLAASAVLSRRTR